MVSSNEGQTERKVGKSRSWGARYKTGKFEAAPYVSGTFSQKAKMSETGMGHFGYSPRREDQEWKQKQQTAAYALRHYSVLVQHAIQKGEVLKPRD